MFTLGMVYRDFERRMIYISLLDRSMNTIRGTNVHTGELQEYDERTGACLTADSSYDLLPSNPDQGN